MNISKTVLIIVLMTNIQAIPPIYAGSQQIQKSGQNDPAVACDQAFDSNLMLWSLCGPVAGDPNVDLKTSLWLLGDSDVNGGSHPNIVPWLLYCAGAAVITTAVSYGAVWYEEKKQVYCKLKAKVASQQTDPDDVPKTKKTGHKQAKNKNAVDTSELYLLHGLLLATNEPEFNEVWARSVVNGTNVVARFADDVTGLPCTYWTKQVIVAGSDLLNWSTTATNVAVSITSWVCCDGNRPEGQVLCITTVYSGYMLGSITNHSQYIDPTLQDYKDHVPADGEVTGRLDVNDSPLQPRNFFKVTTAGNN